MLTGCLRHVTLPPSMAKSFSLQVQLRAVMDVMSAEAVRQICELVDGDLTRLRLELARAHNHNAALSARAAALEEEVRFLRRGKKSRSVHTQTLEVSDAPSINGIYGKEWCSSLWDQSEQNPEDTAIDVDLVVTKEPETQDHSKPQPIKEENSEKEICQDKKAVKTTGASNRKKSSKTNDIVEVNLVDDDDDVYVVSAGFSKMPDGPTMASGSPKTDSAKLIAVDGTFEHVIVPSQDQLAFEEHCMPVEFFEAPQFEGQDGNSSQNLVIDSESMCSSGGSQRLDYLDPFDEQQQFGSEEESAKTKHSCSECSKTFTRPGNLASHTKKCHQKLNSHMCQTCKVVFPQKNLLRTHKCLPPEKLSKTCRLNFRCEHCGKQFHSRANLKVHYAVHTGERPHTCSFCGKGFSQKGNLNTHERIHKGERPFICVFCGKAFTQKINLTQHLSVHSNGRKTRLKKHVEKTL